ncbi:MAG: hypothetical protein NVSMB9_18940 [Isosphaeraceae bacterium]
MECRNARRVMTYSGFALLLMAGTHIVSPASSAPEVSPRVELTTVYLQHPVQKYHRILVEGVLGGRGKMTFDPNQCQVSDAGELSGCTEIALVTRNVTFKLIRSEGGRRLYDIEGHGIGNTLYLVAPVSPKGAYRLVYNDRGDHTPYPITLEPSTDNP